MTEQKKPHLPKWMRLRDQHQEELNEQSRRAGKSIEILLLVGAGIGVGLCLVAQAVIYSLPKLIK